MKTKTLLGIGVGLAGAYALTRRTSTSLGATSAPLTTSLPVSEVMGTIKRVARDLGAYITQASDLTGSPAWLITTISAHEIRFAPYGFVNPAVGATGPMQLTPDTIFDMYHFAQKWNLVTPACEAFLKGKMGKNYPRFVALANNRQSDKALARVYLRDIELNIVLGALLIRTLMHYFTENGVVNYARFVLGYNRGIGYTVKNITAAKTGGFSAIKLIASLPAKMKEAKNYIKNMVGKGGYIEQGRAYFGA